MALGISKLFGRGRGNLAPENTDSDSYAGTVVPLDNDGETELAVAGSDDTDGAKSILDTGRAGLAQDVMKDGSDNITLENYATSGADTDEPGHVVEDAMDVILNVRESGAGADGLLPHMEQSNISTKYTGGGLLGASGGEAPPDGDAADAVEYGLLTAARGEAEIPEGFSLPEVGDEVLRQAGPGGPSGIIADIPHMDGEMTGLISEVGFPAVDAINQDNGGLEPVDEHPDFGAAVDHERGLKWQPSEYDAAKNEVSIETLEASHGGASAPHGDAVAEVETAIPAVVGLQPGRIEYPNLKFETEVVDYRAGGVNDTTLEFNPKEVSVDKLGEPEAADGIMVWNGQPVSHGVVDDEGPSTLLGDALEDGDSGLASLALPTGITSAVDVVDYISSGAYDDSPEAPDI